MRYSKMPRGSEELSLLGFGLMRLPLNTLGQIDYEKSYNIVKYALDRGVNYLDTAYFYHFGQSEDFLGYVLNRYGNREKLYIADKLPTMMIKNSTQFEEIFNTQIERTGAKYFDYYLLHALDGKTWDRMVELGVIPWLEEKQKMGLIRHIGFSFHGPKKDFFRIADEYDFHFAQIQYNLLDVHFQAGIEGINYCQQKGMGVVIMEPLKGGALSNRVPSSINKLLSGKTMAEWAFRFIYDHPAINVVLSGMGMIEHVSENICIAAMPPLTEEEKKNLALIQSSYQNLFKVGCTGCEYCLPCPAKINIPQAFKNLNNHSLYSKFGATVNHGIFLGAKTIDGKHHFASDCIDCGVCEKRCPQNIEIRKELKNVTKTLETPVAKIVGMVARFLLKNTRKKEESKN